MQHALAQEILENLANEKIARISDLSKMMHRSNNEYEQAGIKFDMDRLQNQIDRINLAVHQLD